MAITYIGLGSNIEPERQLEEALEALGLLGVLKNCSPRYHTEPMGEKDQPWFINQAVELETSLLPLELLRRLKKIERELGRKDRGRWQPREIDLDILLYENQTVASVELTIPHPGLAKRRFVLVPLAEIAPQTRDPKTGKTITQLFAECQDRLRVEPYG